MMSQSHHFDEDFVVDFALVDFALVDFALLGGTLVGGTLVALVSTHFLRSLNVALAGHLTVESTTVVLPPFLSVVLVVIVH
jgi:hypothetical protein